MSVTDVNGRLLSVAGGRLRDQKREETRQRLLDAARLLFAEKGYEHTTSAEIAQAAGVTERTLFRHFPSKADLMLANFRQHGAALRAAMRDQPHDARPAEVVRAGVLAFAERLARATEQEREETIAAYGERLPVLTMLKIVLSNEAAIAAELGQRLERSDEDADIRMVANASVGVLRAAGRAYVIEGQRRGSLVKTVSEGIDRLAPLFDALDHVASRRRPRRQREP
jgi:AcrR family transcriptional regulator